MLFFFSLLEDVLLAWDLVIVKTIGAQWSHFHVQALFQFSDMLEEVDGHSQQQYWWNATEGSKV